MHTTIAEGTDRIIVIDDISKDTPQAFTICVKDPSDWEEIHNYIINENEIDGIPNRRINCISELQCSSKRSEYEISVNEADILRLHPKIEWVERSTMHNPLVLEQRKYDEKFDSHTLVNRFKEDIVNLRTNQNPGNELNFTQWGLYRHQSQTNNYVGVGTTTTNSDIQYSLTGRNVDVVIMDTGVRWDHPEFLKPGYTSVPIGIATETVSRVRDIIIHGTEEYGINWSSHGLVAAGSGALAGYAKTTALNSTTFNGSWHGSHVAGTAAGNQFGAAFESNIWSIACVDRSDIGFTDPSDAFDYIKVWHKNKPINPETGRRNPTIVNGSWGFRQFVYWGNPISYPYTVSFRGSTYSSTQVESSSSFLPAIYYMATNGSYYQFTSTHATSQSKVDEFFDDPECDDIIVVFAAGNSGSGNGKQDIPTGVDYNNQFLTGLFYYGDVAAESNGSVSEYFNRLGTPNISHHGQIDAPIVVGALDSLVSISGITSERKAIYSNNGPSLDVWAAGSTVLSPYNSGYPDPRNPSSFYNSYLSGTSMACPNVCGVIALHLQSIPTSNRVDVRNWFNRHAKISIGTYMLDQYANTNPVGAGVSQSYWSDPHGLRGSTKDVLFNPYANNIEPSISGILFSQS